MMKRAILILLLLIISILQTGIAKDRQSVAAQELRNELLKKNNITNINGITGFVPQSPVQAIEPKTLPSVLQFAPECSEPVKSLKYEEDWVKLDSVFLHTTVDPSGRLGVKVTPSQKKLEVVNTKVLTETATQAVLKAPAWLRIALENTLSLMNATKQNLYANLILDAVDPYIDEIAFSIAYSSPFYLETNYAYPQLYTENAQLLYKHDSDLAYVNIIDHGTSETDENYYSTVSYVRIDADGNAYNVEVPKEIYYMYIVHPKISDEYETYINPDLAEDNSSHTTNIAAPPTGRFWRDFLYNFTEPKSGAPEEWYPILKDSISTAVALWVDQPDNPAASALKIITKWINDVMDFTSETERPHQPIRIYKLHIGRCGEHEDLAAAAARTCLIPARCIEAYSSDHVWNEFWDEQWWQWEPVNNSYREPLCYEQGWGKKFGSFNARISDGVQTTVEGYTVNPCYLTFYAKDAYGKPLDGAIITLYVKGTLDDTNIYFDTYGIADNEGKCNFVLSAERTYYGRVTSDFGNKPTQDGYVDLVLQNCVKDQHYTRTFSITGTKSSLQKTSVAQPTENMDKYMVRVNMTVNNQVTFWYVLLNDYAFSYVSKYNEGGTTNLLVADEEKYLAFIGGGACNVFDNSQLNVSTLSADIPVSSVAPWYLWLSNDLNYLNLVDVSVSFALYASPTVGAEESLAKPLISAYPNPMSSTQNYQVSLTQPANLNLSIYDSFGNEVKLIFNGLAEAGDFNLQWNGTDNNGNPVPDGMYFYKLNCDNMVSYNKIILMR